MKQEDIELKKKELLNIARELNEVGEITDQDLKDTFYATYINNNK